MKIAVITPVGRSDMLADTILDGLLWLKREGSDIDFRLPESPSYETSLEVGDRLLTGEKFLEYAKSADLVVLCWGKGETNKKLAMKIGRFDRTIFIDGSELGGNRRYDFDIEQKVIAGTYASHGAIDSEMLEKCALYFRREKPYVRGIHPLPFGIESRYVEFFDPKVKKDIDFFCVFGQDEFPTLRRHVREAVKKFCGENGFTCQVEKTSGFTFDPKRKDGREEFYRLLARSKVGVSVGGGGFDTSRFWEILGNNCLLMSERINVYEADSKRLDYARIVEFNNLSDFSELLPKVADQLKKSYDQPALEAEYQKIIAEHSSKARVLEVIARAKLKVGLP